MPPYRFYRCQRPKANMKIGVSHQMNVIKQVLANSKHKNVQIKVVTYRIKHKLGRRKRKLTFITIPGTQ